jgi:hypothetical protein
VRGLLVAGCGGAGPKAGREGCERTAAALARLADQLPHGSKATYTNYGCRIGVAMSSSIAVMLIVLLLGGR